MAKQKYPYKQLEKLLYADGGLSADDLTALSEVTASSAELNLLDGLSAPGNATASKAVVLDANKALLGLRRAVTVNATGGPLTEAHSRGIFTNEGATGAATFILPAAVAGLEFAFRVMTAQVGHS